ncbi:CvpA family protein [Desulfonauticus submarinus]
MNFLDIVFIIIITFFLLRGIYRGLVQEVSSIVALFLGFLLANKYWQNVLPYVEKILPPSSWTNVISYFVVLLGVMLGVYIISTILKHILKIAFLGWLDKIAGGSLGLLKAIILCSIILMIMTSFLPTNAPVLKESKLAPYIHQVSNSLSALLPEELKNNFERKKLFWERKWRKKILPKLEDN